MLNPYEALLDQNVDDRSPSADLGKYAFGKRNDRSIAHSTQIRWNDPTRLNLDNVYIAPGTIFHYDAGSTQNLV
jgi:hypothetical protein